MDASDRRHIARPERLDRELARDARGVACDLRLALVVVAGRDRVCRRQHGFDRVSEPSRGAVADQLSADEQHEHRRDNRQPEQRQHQLGAEPRERQPASSLDDQLDDVPRQHEGERDQHHQDAGRERVDHDLGQEIGVHLRRLVGENAHADERRDEGEDPERGSGAGCHGAAVVRLAPAAPPPCAREGSGECRWQGALGRSSFPRYSLAFRRSFNSVMNSPMSRKWR